MTVKGSIFKIDRFAIHEGPGIRTVVFMKGCPLRCSWCSSPESHSLSPEMGFYADRCVQCGDCVDACPVKAITVSPKGRIVTDTNLCDHCGECVAICSVGARKLMGEAVTVEDVLHEIEKDSAFYHNSGGGITLTGGEPTLQPEFAAGILKGCFEREFHTAMGTSGYAKWEILNKLLPLLDLIYVDIKHMSSKKHRELTGKNNDLILMNVKKIETNYPNLPLIVRIPIIPGVNDDVDNITKTAEFVSRLNQVERIEIVPYHRYGISTYSALFRDYSLIKVKIPTEEHLNGLASIIHAYHIPVQIGV